MSAHYTHVGKEALFGRPAGPGHKASGGVSHVIIAGQLSKGRLRRL